MIIDNNKRESSIQQLQRTNDKIPHEYTRLTPGQRRDAIEIKHLPGEHNDQDKIQTSDP